MEVRQVKQASLMRNWRSYLVIAGILVLWVVLPIAALLHFQEEIKQAQAYGYLGVFVVGLLCGVTVIPAPTQLLIFTFGHVLNPWLVGLISGFGGAIGGMTVYLTGAGVVTVWSKLRKKEKAFEHSLGIDEEKNSLKKSQFWIIGKAFYDRLADWISGRKGDWALFITSALVISPFYPAGLAAGSLGMGLTRFFLISWAGKTVRYISVAFAGYWGLEFISRLLR